jgi:predicted nucleic acid-binding protein
MRLAKVMPDRPRANPFSHLLCRLPDYAGAMARYVIDAPTLLHVLDSNLRLDPTHQLVAPNSIRSEALQLLLCDVRQGKRLEKAALATHERVTELKMRLLGDRVSRGVAWRIAREHDWETLRDAEYLAIARLQADALVTVDAGLAAKAENVVAVAPLRALLTEE